MRIAWALIACGVVAACDGSDPVEFDVPAPAEVPNWSLSTGTDAVSRAPWSDAKNYSQGMTLVVRCEESKFEVYIVTGFITDSGAVRYRIDTGGQIVANWSESTDYRGLFYKGGTYVAFADQLARSSELVFATREFAGSEHMATFKLPGLAKYLPQIKSMCGV